MINLYESKFVKKARFETVIPVNLYSPLYGHSNKERIYTTGIYNYTRINEAFEMDNLGYQCCRRGNPESLDNANYKELFEII